MSRNKTTVKLKANKKIIVRDKQGKIPKSRIFLFLTISILLISYFIFISLTVIPRDKGLSIFGVKYIQGIDYDEQVIDGEVAIKVLRFKAIDHDEIDQTYVNKRIFVSNSLNEEYLWEAKITAVNETNKTVSITINQFYPEQDDIPFNDIHGISDGNVGLWGKLVYSSSQPLTYILLIVIVITVPTALYFTLLKKKNKLYEVRARS